MGIKCIVCGVANEVTGKWFGVKVCPLVDLRMQSLWQ